MKRDLARAVKDRGQARDRISELSRQITLATQEAQLLERHIDRLLGELSAAHRAEIAVTADWLVQP